MTQTNNSTTTIGPALRLPIDAINAIFALVRQHTPRRLAAVYPMTIGRNVAIHSGEQIEVEYDSPVHEALNEFLTAHADRSWLLVDTDERTVRPARVSLALRTLVNN